MADSTVCTACISAAEQNIKLEPTKFSKAHYARVLGVSERTITRHYQHPAAPKLPGLKESSVSHSDPEDVKDERASYQESSTGERVFEVIEDRNITMDDVRRWLESSGENPDDWHYSARSITYGKSGNQRFSNKMSAWPKHKFGSGLNEVAPEQTVDPVQILQDLRGSEPYTNYFTEELGVESAFVVSLNDTQIGKGEGGGTEGTLTRVYKYVELAKERILELRAQGRNLETLVILGGGDIVEGTCIFPNQSYTIDMARRDQIRTAVALILHVIDQLAAYFPEVRVLATRGNHGENRIDGNKTTVHDNDDLLVFEMAKSATDRDADLAHVSYVIAEEEAAVYTDILGWRLATTHGDVYGKGVQGATQDKKAQAWYKNMAMARNPVGRADVLITHHFHHDKMSDWGACLWRQTPAQDGGSMWFEQTSGEFSQPGMLTFVMTKTERYTDERVLR